MIFWEFLGKVQTEHQQAGDNLLSDFEVAVAMFVGLERFVPKEHWVRVASQFMSMMRMGLEGLPDKSEPAEPI